MIYEWDICHSSVSLLEILTNGNRIIVNHHQYWHQWVFKIIPNDRFIRVPCWVRIEVFESIKRLHPQDGLTEAWRFCNLCSPERSSIWGRIKPGIWRWVVQWPSGCRCSPAYFHSWGWFTGNLAAENPENRSACYKPPLSSGMFNCRLWLPKGYIYNGIYIFWGCRKIS